MMRNERISLRVPLLVIGPDKPVILRRVVGSDAAIELRARVDPLQAGQVVSLSVIARGQMTGSLSFQVPEQHAPPATLAPCFGEGWFVSYDHLRSELSLTLF